MIARNVRMRCEAKPLLPLSISENPDIPDAQNAILFSIRSHLSSARGLALA
jgi:hypothetical protein